ncbi:hypothetical protein BaRGS_00003832 [Batillaria attramentaria]|uniref:Uncharacterized protein n=1 Tax=Batillaria attramentaria TaxID=370345 RepID=A0ABD0M0H5_9CAEN
MVTSFCPILPTYLFWGALQERSNFKKSWFGKKKKKYLGHWTQIRLQCNVTGSTTISSLLIAEQSLQFQLSGIDYCSQAAVSPHSLRPSPITEVFQKDKAH